MEVCNEKEEKYFVWINIGIGEEMGYFRNKLNRIPKNINALKRKSSNWVLLRVVYINIYGDKNGSVNKGLACTEKTDPKDMETYNFSGRYYKDGVVSVSGLNHLLLDLAPYEKYGNKSIDDLPKEGEKSNQNEGRYNYDSDAQQAREIFEGGWQGLKE